MGYTRNVKRTGSDSLRHLCGGCRFSDDCKISDDLREAIVGAMENLSVTDSVPKGFDISWMVCGCPNYEEGQTETTKKILKEEAELKSKNRDGRRV